MALDPRQAEATRARLLSALEMEQKGMQAVLAEMPEDKLGFTPDPKLRPFNTLFHHICATGPFFADILTTGKVDFSGGEPEPPKTKKEMTAVCQKMHEQTMATLKNATPDQLVREVPFGSIGTFPAVEYMNWHLVHLVHHRGQLTVYLRLAGAKVPSIYGGSLDYPMSM